MTTFDLTTPSELEATRITLQTNLESLRGRLSTQEVLNDTQGTLISSLQSRIAELAALIVPPIIPPVVVPPPPPSPTGLLFKSDWVSGSPKDNWDTYDEFGAGGLLSVVPGFGPGGRSALRVLQRGPSYAANLRKMGIITPGQDYYVSFYFRTDDTSSSGDHIATCELYTYGNLTYLRKNGGPVDWRHTVSMYGCGFVYPIGHWHLRNRLANLKWYRLAFFVHWTSPTSVQVHPRVYDENNVLLYQDSDYWQEDYQASGALSFKGKNDWTLESYYGAGYSFCVRPQYLTEFGVGNNGQTGAVSTGLPWYFAGVEIRNDTWPGP